MWWFFFLALTEPMRFPVEFCVVKFSSFGYGFDGLWNKEWQEPKLGDAHCQCQNQQLSITIVDLPRDCRG